MPFAWRTREIGEMRVWYTTDRLPATVIQRIRSGRSAHDGPTHVMRRRAHAFDRLLLPFDGVLEGERELPATNCTLMRKDAFSATWWSRAWSIYYRPKSGVGEDTRGDREAGPVHQGANGARALDSVIAESGPERDVPPQNRDVTWR